MKIKPKQQTHKVNPLKELKERKSLLDTLTGELEEKEVEFFRPKEIGGSLNINSNYLTLPSDITSVEGRQLGKYLNAFTQQRMYIRTLISWQEIAIEEKKRDYYNSSQGLYDEMTEKKLSETAKERMINSDMFVNPVFLEYKNAKKKLLLLLNNLECINDAIFLVSREISRRESDWSTEKRNDNVSRK